MKEKHEVTGGNHDPIKSKTTKGRSYLERTKEVLDLWEKKYKVWRQNMKEQEKITT